MPAKPRVTEQVLGAWVIKSNPKIARLPDPEPELGFAYLDNWLMLDSYRARMMADRQRIALWVTGRGKGQQAPGFWGFGHVNGPAYEVFADDETDEFFEEDIYTGRVILRVPIMVPILTYPLPRAHAQADPVLSGMELFRAPQQGNPGFLTHEEVAAIEQVIGAWPSYINIHADDDNDDG